MEIVAFDADDKADGSGKAKITWLSKTALVGALNNSSKTYEGATNEYGGGWTQCDRRMTLNGEFLNAFPSNVKSNIAEVTKISKVYSYTANDWVNISTQDKVWIPSAYELTYSNPQWYENEGARYDEKITSQEDLNAGYQYWLRSGSGGTSSTNRKRARYVDIGGSIQNDTPIYDKFIRFGFCTD